MLLYTRLAPPKIPKRRSRAGCSHCKEKKKKCDEARPQCSRCVERGQPCEYEPAKPRQRRKRVSPLGLTHCQTLSQTQSSPDGISYEWDEAYQRKVQIDDPAAAGLVTMGSPLDSDLDTSSLFASPSAELPLLSPADSIPFRFPPDEGDDEEPVEEIKRQDCGTEMALLSSRSLHPDLAMIAPVPAGSPRLEFVHQAFSEFTDRPNRRALVDHFCNVLSHLIVFREESGNPFQQLVLPLCYKSSACMNAIYALASAHLEYRGIMNPEKSTSFHNRAILELATLIEQDGEANRNELLATIMLLVYHEVLVQRGRSNIVDGHLKGALTVMSGRSDKQDPTSIFLERAFRFYDVISALSFGSAPLSPAPRVGGLQPLPPLDAPETSPLSNVDILLGMATSLWPLLHQLSELLPLKNELEKAIGAKKESKIASLQTRLATSSHAIETALQKWQPTLPPSFSLEDDRSAHTWGEAADERARIQSILNNALAYRHSALVYLYRTIRGYSTRHALVQRHAHVSLTHCVSTVSHAGPMGALLWPLFVAACEAVSLGDRDLARQAFVAVDRRQGMMNIERAWHIVQEVWQRSDLLQETEVDLDTGLSFRGADLWRRVSRDMGVTIIFG